mgnify:CR=1 FL=1
MNSKKTKLLCSIFTLLAHPAGPSGHRRRTRPGAVRPAECGESAAEGIHPETSGENTGGVRTAECGESAA